MTSKLEPGCRAIVTEDAEPADYGKLVTVGNFIGRFINPEGTYQTNQTDIWEVSEPMLGRGPNNEVFGYFNIQSASALLRIDDHPENETILETIDLEEGV